MSTLRKYVLPYNQIDLSGGIQGATSRFLQKRNELDKAKNALFNKTIGSATRRDGYEQVGRTIQHGSDGLGLHVYRYSGNNKVISGINNANNSFATLQYLDTADYWTTILSNASPNTRFDFQDYLEEMYVAGFSPDTNLYQTLTNVDSSLTPSTTRNVAYAPKARFITEYGGSLYAINVDVNGAKYKDRAYISSPAQGAITFVQNDQQGNLQQLQVDSAKYLKAGMLIDIYSAGTNQKVIDSLSIVSVNKNKNIITFALTAINLKDNDELWLQGRKGQLSVLWNTDYPTPESADFIRIPPGVDSDPTIRGYGKNNNRLLLFTRNSTWKWDGNVQGGNLVNISDTIGCVADQTVRNIAGWTIWLHTTGVWGYNDATGQFKLLSRAVEPYIKAINLATISKASAVVSGRMYKLAVGEIADLDASTTSTSTSSTSTSSTSSSTSSTSTSSTSTSSTSQSTSTNTTTSTSSTSSSTSSTSTSSTSISTSSTSSSISTSSTSTSLSTSSTTTQTVASTKNVLRFVYDWDSNTWWTEFHKREFRFQVTHTMNGYTKPYFQDETGRVFRDETGNLDNADQIPFEIETGRSDFGTPTEKNYTGCIILSEKAKGALVLVSRDNGNWVDVGQVTQDIQEFRFPAEFRGRDINYRISYNNQGDGPSVDGITTYFSSGEYKVI